MTDELTLTYDGSEKSKELLIQMANTSLGMNQGPVTLEITSVCEKQRTLTQNKALHKWFEMCAQECMEHGTDVRLFFEKASSNFECAFDKESFKHLIYKPTLKAMRDKDSTTDMNTVEPSEVCEALSQGWVKRFGYPLPPFPSLENQRTQSIGRAA
jgi:hypothetical protein